MGNPTIEGLWNGKRTSVPIEYICAIPGMNGALSAISLSAGNKQTRFGKQFSIRKFFFEQAEVVLCRKKSVDFLRTMDHMLCSERSVATLCDGIGIISDIVVTAFGQVADPVRNIKKLNVDSHVFPDQKSVGERNAVVRI